MKKLILTLFFISAIVFAQKDYSVHSFKVEDEIDRYSPIDPSIGRYEMYRFFVNSGDRYKIEIKTEGFQPGLIIISPQKETILLPSNGGTELIFDSTANVSGAWEMYIIADTSDRGKFEYKMSFAANEVLTLPQNNSFCNVVKYFTEHSIAEFIFLNKNETGKVNWIESSEKDSGELTIQVVNTDEIQDFQAINKKLKNCIGLTWSYKDESSANTKKIVFNDYKLNRYVILLQRGSNSPLLIFGRS